MNSVKLNFDEELINLAGYDFGKNTYETQIKGKINLQSNFEIEFPDEIKGVASSFVQGLFGDIINQIGLLNTEKRVMIKSSSVELGKNLLLKLR